MLQMRIIIINIGIFLVHALEAAMQNRSKLLLSRSISIALLSSMAVPALAQPAPLLEEFLIIGSRENARQLAGSGAVVAPEQIRIEAATDINQLLKTIPGIYIREEDGLGLRPNIGIRGATSERSSKITLLEDGVLMAPAPYSDPAAYYFPTAQRQTAVEVLKGAPLLRYGPQTTGGVVNLVSTLIPDANRGSLQLMTDERGLTDVHGWYGGRNEQWGWLLETVQREGKGFKDIDRSSNAGNLDIEDYVAKLGWQSAAGVREQSLQLKLQYSEEVSDETYLGLTDADFKRNSKRRYGMSAIDSMDNYHSSLQLNYRIALTENLLATAVLYENNFTRDWFKLDGGNTYINAANTGDKVAQGILDGELDRAGLRYKHNNRSYLSRGAELNLRYTVGNHTLDTGLRSHEDEADRYQEVELYDQVNGALNYRRTLLPGAGDNRIGSSDALSFWLVDSWQPTDDLTVTAALRLEDVESREVRYNDIQRSSINRLTPSDAREWLPGLSLTYGLTDQWQLLAGVHRGFSTLGAGALANEEPETSDNWEAGVRYHSGDWYVEGIGFYSDFSNKTENCSLASPCSNGSNYGSYRTGEAVIAGLEWQASTELSFAGATLPIDFTYTWTDAEMSRDNTLTGVRKGDALKDVPEQVYSLRAGLELDNNWNNYLVAKYVDETCSRISCNRIAGSVARTESLLVLDWISRLSVSENIELFLKVENMFDEQQIISRDPDGARPNKPRTASLGVQILF